jgi:uncharacterized protein
MNNMWSEHLLAELEDGRTDLILPLLESGLPSSYRNRHGVSLMQTCAYYGDVTAIRSLIARGESLEQLGQNLGLSNASFHGHWRLCKLLLERGADVNDQSTETKETPLHAAICKMDRTTYDPVLQVLLAHGANPNLATVAGVATEGFMRDCRTKGETALHRAAAFGEEGTIKLLLDAGAQLDARDAYQDTPLSWASWYLRPAGILSLLCYGEFHVNPQRKTMKANLVGFPHLG